MVLGLNRGLRTLIDFHSNIASLKLETWENKGVYLEIDSHICENVFIAKFPHLKTLRH